MMINKINKKKELWSEKSINYVGLPRPIFKVDKNFLKKIPFVLSRIVPVPFQSKPIFSLTDGIFHVIQENEKNIFIENRCTYCGIQFNNDEYCVRWKTIDFSPNFIGPRVFSDNYPLTHYL